MADLKAKSPCDGLLPRTIGTVEMTEVLPDGIWGVAALAGSSIGLPKAGRTQRTDGAVWHWTGPGQALVFGKTPEVVGAAVTDQSDAWAVVEVRGVDSLDVLARLVPIDLSPQVFKRGHTARTFVGHMTASVTRTGADSFQVMVMRSMAGTLVHELSEAATRVKGRCALN